MHVAKGTPDEDKLADWAKATDDAFNKDDAKAVVPHDGRRRRLLAELHGGPAMKGKKDLQKRLAGWSQGVPRPEVDAVSNAWGIDGFAIIEHTVSGHDQGRRWGRSRATGKPVDGWHVIDIMQPTADGKIGTAGATRTSSR